MDLNPVGEPPTRFARWCPYCQQWKTHTGARRCVDCGTAVIRQTKVEKPKPGELRPGVIAEFDDPRDRYDATDTLADLRARLHRKCTETHGV
jgi:hypothetical protein